MTRESAVMSLIYRGYPLVSQVVNKGEYTTFEYGGDELLVFRLDDVFNATGAEKAWLGEVLAGSVSSDGVVAPKLDITVSSPEYAYKGEVVPVNVSVVNRGEQAFSGDVEVVVTLGGGHRVSLGEHLVLAPGEGKKWLLAVDAPEKPDEYTVVGVLRTGYASIRDEDVVVVKVLNPAVTTFSLGVREEGGIRGQLTLGLAFADDLVDWDLPVSVDVYLILEKGKKPVYSEEVVARGRSTDFFIPYERFYQGDGRYVVVARAGGVEDNEYLELVGVDFEYDPSEESLPPTIDGEGLQTQLLLLFMALVAVLTIRNQFYRNIMPLRLDLAFMGGGTAVTVLAVLLSMNDSTIKGIILLSAGIFLFILRRYDARMSGVFSKHSHLHDLSSLIVIFMAGGFLIKSVSLSTANLLLIGIPVAYGFALGLSERMR
ncbi:MAG: hypothetical protein ACXQTM_05600 [Methanosarcinales archaeon]